MTNEEKTISILQKFGVLPKNYTDFELLHAKNHMDWAMLIQMAEWKDAKIGELKQVLIDKACEWLKRELAEPMPDEMYKKWCDEKLVDFCKIMEE